MIMPSKKFLRRKDELIAAILQPGYLPWLGFFEQMDYADVFVVYDSVQYDTQSWRNRNRIKTVNGIQWLTVPVKHKNHLQKKINEVEIDNHQNWGREHLNSIKHAYSNTPFFEDYIYFFEELYKKEWNRLLDLDLEIIQFIVEELGIKTKVVLSSELASQRKRAFGLIDLCKQVGAKTLYEGAAGKNYIKEEKLKKENIEIVFQDFKHHPYPQLFGEFIPSLSTIDLLFNCGKESLEIIRKGH